MEIKTIQSKSILTPSKLPDTDFVINPYTGCRFGCSYCYASFMSRYVGKDIKDWGEFVYVKENAPELLTKSDLVLRDIDLFKQFNNVEVGLTVTSTDDTISRYFEKYAPDVSKRFK